MAPETLGDATSSIRDFSLACLRQSWRSRAGESMTLFVSTAMELEDLAPASCMRLEDAAAMWRCAFGDRSNARGASQERLTIKQVTNGPNTITGGLAAVKFRTTFDSSASPILRLRETWRLTRRRSRLLLIVEGVLRERRHQEIRDFARTRRIRVLH